MVSRPDSIVKQHTYANMDANGAIALTILSVLAIILIAVCYGRSMVRLFAGSLAQAKNAERAPSSV